MDLEFRRRHDLKPKLNHITSITIPGTYAVELTTTNATGRSASTLAVDVANATAPPVASFHWIGREPLGH